MQTLKPELRNRILQNAVEEFFNFGYENSSLRRIASSASTTVGNLYRYFDNKDDLFSAVVTPAVEIIHSFTDHEMTDFSSLSDDCIEDMIHEDLEPIILKISEFRREIIILFRGSSGTAFEKGRTLFIKHFVDHVNDHFAAEGLSLSQFHIQGFQESIAVSFLEGFLTILEKNYSVKQLQVELLFFIKYFVNSFISMMRKERKK